MSRFEPLEFVIPRSYSPSRSLLGRLIRRRTGDRLHAGALYIEIVTLGAVAWLLIDFAAWGLLSGRIQADPGGRLALFFFGLQVIVPLVGVLTAGFGFRSDVRIRLDAIRLTIARGEDRIDLGADDILAAESMDALEYHRGPRLLRSTRPFINRPVERVLAITTPHGLIVLGLAPSELETLAAALQRSMPRPARPDPSTDSNFLPAS